MCKTVALRFVIQKMGSSPMVKRGRPKKPKGTGSVNISLRIDEALLARLKRFSHESGHDNLSREIMNRLKASFVPKRDEDPAMRALCFLISHIAKSTSPPAPGSDKSGVWRSNPFFFAAFKLAVAQLLDALTPPGEIIPPELPPPITGLKKTEFAYFPEHYE